MIQQTVLITNDDGIHAPGIVALTESIQSLGFQTLVVAPRLNQTGKGQALTIDNELLLRELANGKFELSGTPVDCVRTGLQLELFSELDICLVVSGVNNGLNGGDDLLFSGTLGATSFSARLGVPGIAISQGSGDIETNFKSTKTPADFTSACQVFLEFMGSYDFRKMPTSSFVSINVPYKSSQRHVEWCHLGKRDWSKGRPCVTKGLGEDGSITVDPWATEPFHDGTGDFNLLEQGIPTASVIQVDFGGAFDSTKLRDESSLEDFVQR